MSLHGLLGRKGAAVTFTSSTSTVDPATDQSSSPVTSTVTGRAMQVLGEAEQYKSLELIESDNPTLLFSPDALGVLPALGASVSWGGNDLVVKAINPLALNGTATAARLVVGR